MNIAAQNRLHEPAVLEQQVKRMLKDPRAEALAVNFAGQWLNLRGLGSSGPLPMIYPDFDDPLRQAMRREVELLFDDIVQTEDQPLLALLVQLLSRFSQTAASDLSVRIGYRRRMLWRLDRIRQGVYNDMEPRAIAHTGEFGVSPGHRPQATVPTRILAL